MSCTIWTVASLLDGGKLLRDVDLPESLAQRSIGGLDAPLPACPLLLTALQLASIEIEGLVVEGLRKRIARSRVDQLPAQVSLGSFQVRRAEQRI